MTHGYNTEAIIIRTDIYEKPGNIPNNTKSKRTALNYPDNKTGISAPSNLHRLWLRCPELLNFTFFIFSPSFLISTAIFLTHAVTSDDI